jgi:hypothetical protein
MFLSTVVIDGKIEGLWRKTVKKHDVTIGITSFRDFVDAETRELHIAAENYGKYIGLNATVN